VSSTPRATSPETTPPRTRNPRPPVRESVRGRWSLCVDLSAAGSRLTNPTSWRIAMAETVGDYVLQRLREWGVEQVFAYPGDGLNGIIAAFGKADDSPAFIQSRHEEMSAFEAVGYAKFSG